MSEVEAFRYRSSDGVHKQVKLLLWRQQANPSSFTSA